MIKQVTQKQLPSMVVIYKALDELKIVQTRLGVLNTFKTRLKRKLDYSECINEMSLLHFRINFLVQEVNELNSKKSFLEAQIPFYSGT
ncbi:hypothetical protein [Vibrio sp. K4]|uniref:hypothetical protein n=1 Tax=Vibrio sp. K4 TaxID=3391579 RepID=UPI003DA74979|nr:hypothetical protein [Vibrio parahaemolyticus]